MLIAMNDQLPPTLATIVEDFSFAEGREKLELLLEYSQTMPPLPDYLRDHQHMDQVQECMSPVFVHADKIDGVMKFYFDVPEESPTVRGFASLMAQGLNGATPEQVLKVPGEFYREMGLQDVLTSQRMNGIRAILAYMKRLASKELSN
jgi:cysteine desulfuration protein SufE